MPNEGNTKCKMFGDCTNFTTVDKCTTACEFYNPKNPNEVVEIPKDKRPDVKLLPSNLPSFDKQHEFLVIKRHVFQMQSISPKKIILKYKRKLKETDKLPDGCYVFRDREDKLLDPIKVFKKFDREVAINRALAEAKAKANAAKLKKKK